MCTYHIFLSKSSVDRYLGCFHVLAIVISTDMNIGVHVSFQIRVLIVSGYVPRSGFLDHVKVKVTQSCPTLCDPMDYTVHGILKARILEWVAVPFSRGIFPTQRLDPGLPHYRWILYQLSHQGSPSRSYGSSMSGFLKNLHTVLIVAALVKFPPIV